MPAALDIVFAAVFTAAVCLSLGAILLRNTCPDAGARFVAGSAVLSLIVFLLCAVHLAYPIVFLALGSLAIGLARPRLPRPRCSLWLVPFAAFFAFYLTHAMAPEASPDGAAYHLGLVARYLREHGFVRVTDNFYSAMPGGVEMLYLFAFAFGRHSAAAMVHLTFLLALAWQVYSYARTAGFRTAGAAAALLVFASPAAGIDGTSAYNDVALAAIAFTLFHLLQLWATNRAPQLLYAIGLLAGFAFATKYTAWAGVLYAAALVAWKNRRAALTVAACSGIMFAPWLLKNWIYFQNPLAPFFNRAFPNPWITPAFEDTYRGIFALYHLKSRWQIPMQVTTYGELSGILGPVFLLSPLALFALRRREGRQLLLAALVFGASYFGNIAARFLLPVIPFVALAMTIALTLPQLAVALALIHAVLSWPSVVPRYAGRDAWRLSKWPWQEALRLRPEEPYLHTHLVNYFADRLIERNTPPNATIFTFTPIPEAYTSRHIRIEYEAAPNQIAGKILWTATQAEYAPTWRLRFTFPRQPLRNLRLVPTATAAGDFWSIHELRIYDSGRELPRAPRWRLTAQPYPWGIQDAFDNSLATFWICGDTLKPGQFVSVDFHGDEIADSVVIETAPNQPGLRLRLETLDASGRWQTLSAAPQISDAARPLGLRRAVALELQRRGIDYLLVFPKDPGADDLRLNADLWGVTAVGEDRGARLYRIQ